MESWKKFIVREIVLSLPPSPVGEWRMAKLLAMTGGFMPILYIVGTPIGNLEDISLRALRILGEVDFILCEDTRVTGKLLARYNIKTPAISYHQHSDENKEKRIIDLLAGGKNLALVSDAGTPGISDPGGKLVNVVIEKFGDNVKIESAPGPSAIAAALSISGMPADKFIFMGFPPHKKGRQTFVKKVVDSEYTAVVYESKHRIIKFLEELDEISNHGARIVVCRELSKMHETVYRGKVDAVIEKLKENKNNQKGEFAVIIGK